MHLGSKPNIAAAGNQLLLAWRPLRPPILSTPPPSVRGFRRLQPGAHCDQSMLAPFSFARLYNVKFKNCVFALTHFCGCEIEKCTFENCDFVDGMRDRRGARIRRRRSRLPVRIWRLKTPVCGARTSACAWSGNPSSNTSMPGCLWAVRARGVIFQLEIKMRQLRRPAAPAQELCRHSDRSPLRRPRQPYEPAEGH